MEHLVHFPKGFSDATTWVLLGLILFLGLLVQRGVPKMVTGALDARADKIRAELDEARRLREEAQELLASYQRRQRDAEDTAAGIIEQAKRDAERMIETTRSDLAAKLERRRHLAEAKIAQAETEALAKVKAHAATIAVEAARAMLAEGTTGDELFAASLNDLKTKLN